MMGVLNRRSRVFKAWDSSSTVRSKAYCYELTPDDFSINDPEMWFPSLLGPALSHPAVCALPVENRKILHIHYLLYFMDYTAQLEMGQVNEAVQCMSVGGLSEYFSAEDRRMGIQLYVDEGYHALFSLHLADQLATHYALDRVSSSRILNMHSLISSSAEVYKDLTRFCIAFVSETVIVRELLELTRDDLVRPVANMFMDHLHDEGRHSIYFIECFPILWRQLGAGERDHVVETLIKVLAVFSRPDARFVNSLFASHPTMASHVLPDLKRGWVERMRSLSASTIQAISRTDMLRNTHYHQLFKSAGLLS